MFVYILTFRNVCQQRDAQDCNKISIPKNINRKFGYRDKSEIPHNLLLK
jgi:hypothetical protein